MLVITGRLSKEEGEYLEFHGISAESTDEERRQFLSAINPHLKSPLILLERCDEATGFFAGEILRQAFGVDVVNENMVMRVDGARGQLIPGSLVMAVPFWGLYDRSKLREDESPLQYIIRLWNEGKTSFSFAVVPESK